MKTTLVPTEHNSKPGCSLAPASKKAVALTLYKANCVFVHMLLASLMRLSSSLVSSTSISVFQWCSGESFL